MAEPHASRPFFVYTIYIASTPEKVFAALTDAAATGKFWFGNAATSDWEAGSPVTFHREGKLIVQGTVLEHEPPRRLAYSFRPVHDALFSGERPSRVVFDLERQKDQVRLTVTHDDFAEDSKVLPNISKGWPLVISSLKSYLETGRVLYAPWYEKETAAAS
ncbi:MAG TPA: SRPBCC family protein [Pseudolabrys sp.]|nr:SRPBCC family protein [Pseudolabrys sp.]